MSSSRHPWKLPLWGGAAIGILTAAALSWLLYEGTWRFTQGFDLLLRPEALSGGLILLLVGALLGGLVVVPRLHPLVPGIPAAWFAIVYIPSLFRWTTPDWYPRWMELLFLRTHSAAPWVILAVLVVVSVTSLTMAGNRTKQAQRQSQLWTDRSDVSS